MIKINWFALSLKFLFGIPYTKTAIITSAFKKTFPVMDEKKVIKEYTENLVPDRKYKVDKKACQEYLYIEKIKLGMHDLTSKYHKKKK